MVPAGAERFDGRFDFLRYAAASRASRQESRPENRQEDHLILMVK